MDWLKGKFTGNHGFYHQLWGFPVNFPIIQFYERSSTVFNEYNVKGGLEHWGFWAFRRDYDDLSQFPEHLDYLN